jgi:hypothetical protein
MSYWRHELRGTGTIAIEGVFSMGEWDGKVAVVTGAASGAIVPVDGGWIATIA